MLLHGLLLAAGLVPLAAMLIALLAAAEKPSRGAFRVRGMPEKFRYTPPARGAP